MKVDNIDHERNRADTRRNYLKHILDWGDKNDYPQSVVDIVNSSYTGVTCLDTYHKFIFGRGFADSDNYQIIVNSDGATADSLLEMASGDLAQFGGFAFHVNRNMLGQITELRWVPLENLRRCIDTVLQYAGKVALHPDWGSRTQKKFREVPIEYFDIYDPDPSVFMERIAEVGGIQNYHGEIFVYSNRPGEYPLPVYDAVLTDMSTQEAISNISYRNTRRGFLTAGCFAEINPSYDDNNEDDKRAFDAVSDALHEMQGDKNASSLLHVVVPDKDSMPQIVSMKGENYDKEYTATDERTIKAIGQAFRQPEELRCEKTASGFSNDTMVQAYNVYNSITAKERMVLEREFGKLFKQWHQPLEYNFQIAPLSYGAETLLTRLGADTAQKVVEIAKDGTTDVSQRKAILMIVYGLDEDETNKLLNIHVDNNLPYQGHSGHFDQPERRADCPVHPRSRRCLHHASNRRVVVSQIGHGRNDR